MTAASGKQAVEMSKSSAVGQLFCQGNPNHRFSMKNPDAATILGTRTGRLRRETVDGVHEQIKYNFKLILLKNCIAVVPYIVSLWPSHMALNDPVSFIDVSGTFCHSVKNLRGSWSKERGR